MAAIECEALAKPLNAVNLLRRVQPFYDDFVAERSLVPRQRLHRFSENCGSSLEKLQQVGVQLVLVGVGQTVGRAGVNL